MVAVNLRFEDLRARDNQSIDRDFFNRRYKLIAEAIAAIADQVDGVASDSDNLVKLGLVRVDEVLGPLLAKVQAASQQGFLVAKSATSVQLSVGLQTTFEVTAGWQRDLFQPTPYVMLTRAGGGVDDWALFSVSDYNRDNGGLAGEIVATSGVVDTAAYSDWTISATAGIAKTVMEQAAAAQVAIDDAQAAAAAAQQAAEDAEAVLDSGPVSSVNSKTGTVLLGMSDIPDLVSTLGGKAADNHGHAIAEITNLQAALDAKAAASHGHAIGGVTGLQAALDGKSATGHGHAIADVTGLHAALDAAGGANVVVKSAAYAANDGDLILADTSGGSFPITLPAIPEVGATVIVADNGSSWDVNPVVIERNGKTIQGLAEDLNCNIGGVLIGLRYNGTGWRMHVEAGARDGNALTAGGAQTLTNKAIHGNTNTLTADGVNAVGFLNIPQVSEKTGNYTLAGSDAGKMVPVGSGGSITVPNSTFSGDEIVSVFNNTAGDMTITCSIATAYIAGTEGDVASVTLAARGIATIFFVHGTACVINGNVS